MTAARIDALNTALIALSALAALYLPLELFLFSYIILGPLHYLTEISWLHDRRYFLQTKRDLPILLGLGALVLALAQSSAVELNAPTAAIMIFLFGYAAIAALVPPGPQRSGAVFMVLFASVALATFPLPALLALYLLPTLIHVFLFTLLFMLFGAIKANSNLGLFNSLFFTAAAVLVAMGTGQPFWFSPAALELFAPFHATNQAAASLFTGFTPAAHTALTTDLGQALLRFTAFAYTYHYLNWFSKTSIIGWHEVPKPRAIAILVLWVAAVGLYAIDITLGFYVLLGLSFLHVVLEFPLNHLSIRGIAASVRPLR